MQMLEDRVSVYKRRADFAEDALAKCMDKQVEELKALAERVEKVEALLEKSGYEHDKQPTEF